MPGAPGETAAPPILETRLVGPPAAAPPPRGGLSAGALISRTVQIWWRYAIPFTAMSAVANAPMAAGFALAFDWMAGTGKAPPEPAQLAGRVGGLAAGWALTIVLSVVVAGAVTSGTVRHLRGGRAGFGEMLGAGLRRGLPVVGTGLVLWIGVVAGLLLLVVPGIWLAVASCVAVPAAVVERPGVFGAIRRSFELTRGTRWPLFAAGSGVLVIVWLLSSVVQVAALAALSVLPARHAMIGTLVASQLGNALFAVIPVVAVAVAYHDLRTAREGVDTAVLARVFE